MKRGATLGVAVLVAAWLVSTAAAAFAADRAPDFPPGLFIDDHPYSMKDFEGKAVVLFFYEQNCPRCRGEIPNRNKIVEQYQGKPVVFVAVAAGDTLQEAKAYRTSTQLAMPVYADPLSLMEKRYNTSISLQNIWQFRVIGPDGKVIGHAFDTATIDRAVAAAKWKYKDGGYDARLEPAIEKLEWGRYAEGVRLIKPLTKNSKKETAESAKKLLAAVQAEAEGWMAEAEKAVSTEPVTAYDLYQKVAQAFAGDELGKKAGDAVKKLAADPVVKEELAARPMWERLCLGTGRARSTDKGQVADFASQIAKKYPKSPTGQRAAEVAKELAGS